VLAIVDEVKRRDFIALLGAASAWPLDTPSPAPPNSWAAGGDRGHQRADFALLHTAT
jgi:hypothetical protein